MEIKRLSEIIPQYKLNKSSIFSYFMIYSDENGNIELLPSDNHSAAFPLVFNSSKKILNGNVNFFNKSVYNGFTKENLNQINDIEYYFLPEKKEKCLIINLLDNCYGHSLLKLFNLVLFFEKYNGEFDLFVITPPSLLPFIPTKKVNICCVKKDFRELEKGYNIDFIISKINSIYTEIDFAFLNTYQEYSGKDQQLNYLKLFNPQNNSSYSRNIVFYYRKGKSRRWGMLSQRKNIIQFFAKMKMYFSDVNFILLGERDTVKFPSFITDLRCSNYSKDIEYQYNSILSNSILVLGIHGSHLLLPSLLASRVFHILPPFKWKNSQEDVFNSKAGLISNWYSDLNIFVDSAFKYPCGKKVAEKVLFLYMAALEKEYKHCIHLLNPLISQNEYLAQKYPFFNYSKALQHWNKKEAFVLRIHRILKA